jgi:hypothetical protein
LNGHSNRSDNGVDNMDRARMAIWRFSDATITAMRMMTMSENR